MKKLRWLILLCLIGIGVAYAAGVRVHWEAISHNMGLGVVRSYRKVYIEDGKYIVGEFIKETESILELRAGSGTAVFEKGKVLKIETIKESDIDPTEYNAWIKKKTRSFITRRKEDSLGPHVMNSFSTFIADLSGQVADAMAKRFQQNGNDPNYTPGLKETEKAVTD